MTTFQLEPSQGTSRGFQRKRQTSDYFLNNVDTIFNRLITLLLYSQPEDTRLFVTQFMENPIEFAPTANASTKVLCNHRDYFNNQIVPILYPLIKKIAIEKPKDLRSYVLAEIGNIEVKSDSTPIFPIKTIPPILPSISVDINSQDSLSQQCNIALSRTTKSPRASSARLKFEEAKSFANFLNDPQTSSGRTRSKIEDAITLEANLASKDDIQSIAITYQLSQNEPTIPRTFQPLSTSNNESLSTIQIALFGLNNSGKSTILNHIQGSHDKATPTIGFRPITLIYNSNTKLKFYDLGGGSKIRNIWNQYYHDIHSFIYVIDSTSDDEELTSSLSLLQSIIINPMVIKKPCLILLNKFFAGCGRSVEDFTNLIAQKLSKVSGDGTIDESALDWNNILIAPCNVQHESNSSEILDSANESKLSQLKSVQVHIERLIQSIQAQYDVLHKRVEIDIQAKANEDKLKRLERERKVLKSKVALAFHGDMNRQLLYEIVNNIDVVKQKNKVEVPADFEINSKQMDVLSESDGLEFLLAEIGVDSSAETKELLPGIAQTIARLVGYQKMALQIIGGFKVPISKKKNPLTWDEIFDLVAEIRNELGLPVLH